MKRQVNLYEAKTNLSQLVEDAARGDEIIIAKNGKPMAKLTLIEPANEQPKKRALGQWAHLVDPNDKRTPEEWWRDWKAADAEIERDFQNSINENWGKYDKAWADTSSTPTHSSGLREEPRSFAGPRSPKSKKRKTRSS
ncbi:MAG TPA: type II toxin-antitoxin system prevent-host-death family antitoxin [Rhizomicrobium sp.]|jgi:prevent-host-death family protein